MKKVMFHGLVLQVQSWITHIAVDFDGSVYGSDEEMKYKDESWYDMDADQEIEFIVELFEDEIQAIDFRNSQIKC